MTNQDSPQLEKLATTLKDSGRYRVIQKYQRPEYYHEDDPCQKCIGVFVDVETTGLNSASDKIIELGMVRFEYSKDGRIFRIIDEFNKYSDPKIPIPSSITKLTGITDQMVQGHHIDIQEVESYVQNVNLIISHNAQFDRGFFEVMFPNLEPKPWACLMKDVSWREENIESNKLEYIAYRYDFFYEGHRAVIDCLAGIHILSKSLKTSQKLVLTELLDTSRKIIFKLWASGASYASKDLLKLRGYRWETRAADKSQAWSIELTKDKIKDEIAFLKSEIYGLHKTIKLSIPVDIIDAYTRFSNIKSSSVSEKYKNELEWIKQII